MRTGTPARAVGEGIGVATATVLVVVNCYASVASEIGLGVVPFFLRRREHERQSIGRYEIEKVKG
jgi:hypothetical protein